MMEWDLGFQALGVLALLSLVFGVFAQLVAARDTTRWIGLIGAAGFLICGLISEVGFGWANRGGAIAQHRWLLVRRGAAGLHPGSSRCSSSGMSVASAIVAIGSRTLRQPARSLRPKQSRGTERASAQPQSRQEKAAVPMRTVRTIDDLSTNYPETSRSPWRSFYMSAGAAALVSALLVPVQVGVFAASHTPTP